MSDHTIYVPDAEKRDLITLIQLAADGSSYVHCDYRVTAPIHLAFDEVFGRDPVKNEIDWKYSGRRVVKRFFGRKHDTTDWFSKGNDEVFRPNRVCDEQAAATQERLSSVLRSIRGGADLGKQRLNPDGKFPKDASSEKTGGREGACSRTSGSAFALAKTGRLS